MAYSIPSPEGISQDSDRSLQKNLKTGKKNAVAFFDTTLMLPFFELDIEIEAFSLDKFKTFLGGLTEVTSVSYPYTSSKPSCTGSPGETRLARQPYKPLETT